MGTNDPEKRKRRMAVAFSTATDAVLGAVLVLFGLGLLPIRPDQLDIPPVFVIVFGALMFVIGTGVAVYNYSRLDE